MVSFSEAENTGREANLNTEKKSHEFEVFGGHLHLAMSRIWLYLWIWNAGRSMLEIYFGSHL